MEAPTNSESLILERRDSDHVQPGEGRQSQVQPVNPRSVNRRTEAALLNQASRLFITANYSGTGDSGMQLLGQAKLDAEQKMRAECQMAIDNLKSRELKLVYAALWEEYGEHGNPHIHGIFAVSCTNRITIKKWIKTIHELGITVNFNYKIPERQCSNAQMTNYGLGQAKTELWNTHRAEQRDRLFFRQVFGDNEQDGEQHRGSRTDIKTALADCKSFNELLSKYPEVACKGMLAFPRYYQQLNRQHMVEKKYSTQSYWLYGVSGAGKSTACRKLVNALVGDEKHVYTHNHANIKWWDGYIDEEIVIIEELRRENLREAGGAAFLLELLDDYAMQLQIKGGFVDRNYDTVFINQPEDPVRFFTYKDKFGGETIDEAAAQLVRRLTKIIQFTVQPVEDSVTHEITNRVVLTDNTQYFRDTHAGYLKNLVYPTDTELGSAFGIDLNQRSGGQPESGAQPEPGSQPGGAQSEPGVQPESGVQPGGRDVTPGLSDNI